MPNGIQGQAEPPNLKSSLPPGTQHQLSQHDGNSQALWLCLGSDRLQRRQGETFKTGYDHLCRKTMFKVHCLNICYSGLSSGLLDLYSRYMIIILSTPWLEPILPLSSRQLCLPLPSWVRARNKCPLRTSSVTLPERYYLLPISQGSIGVVTLVDGVAVSRHPPRGVEGVIRKMRGVVCCSTCIVSVVISALVQDPRRGLGAVLLRIIEARLCGAGSLAYGVDSHIPELARIFTSGLVRNSIGC